MTESQQPSLIIVPDSVPLAADADGVVRVAGTRVTLDTLVAAYLEGASAETIAEQYSAEVCGGFCPRSW